VRFLGTFIKPGHIVINHRTYSNFKTSLAKYNALACNHKPDRAERSAFIASVNAYPGILRHYKTFKKRQFLLHTAVSPYWHNHIVICAGYKKIIKKLP
jgi:hypothetical protein